MLLPRANRVDIPAFCPPYVKGDPKPACSPAQAIITAKLIMSDETIWNRTDTKIGDGDWVTIFTDADGNEVDAPEVQDGASDTL